ncbi:MAG: hypothetical protein JXB24_12815 [Bacteroidales bacterium]|nr:hypothetical protein [Bacteroidales bacterium]
MCILKIYSLLFVLFCCLAICTPKRVNKEYQISLKDKDSISLIEEPEKTNEEVKQKPIIEMVSDEDSNLTDDGTIEWKFKKHIVLAN